MNDKPRTWLDRAIDDATHHSIDHVASDLKIARGYIESALEVLDIGLRNPEKELSHETLRRIRHAITTALATDPFRPPRQPGDSSDLRRVLTDSIAYACEELKRSPSVPEVRVAVAITANVERVAPELAEPAVAAFRAWRDSALALGHTPKPMLLSEIVERFQADQREHDGANWANLDHAEIAQLLIELFHVRLGRENGERVIYGLRWRTP